MIYWVYPNDPNNSYEPNTSNYSNHPNNPNNPTKYPNNRRNWAMSGRLRRIFLEPISNFPRIQVFNTQKTVHHIFTWTVRISLRWPLFGSPFHTAVRVRGLLLFWFFLLIYLFQRKFFQLVAFLFPFSLSSFPSLPSPAFPSFPSFPFWLIVTSLKITPIPLPHNSKNPKNYISQ